MNLRSELIVMEHFQLSMLQGASGLIDCNDTIIKI